MKKFLIGVVACAALILPVSAGATNGSYRPVKGDATCDRAVDIFDVVRVNNIILGRDVPKPSCRVDIDMNCDGEVNIFDLLLIRIVAFGNENPSTGCAK